MGYTCTRMKPAKRRWSVSTAGGLSLAVLALGLAFPGDAQTLDTFNPGAVGDVYALAVQSDGKIVAGGTFRTLGGQARGCLGRLNAEGSLDTGFNPAVTGGVSPMPTSAVYCLAVQPDGRILVGGGFTSLGGQTRNCLGRLNADGTVDTAFNPGANNIVYCLALQADGKILVGGQFTSLGSAARNYLGRLNADGSIDSTFKASVSSVTTAAMVSTLAIQPDGKILAGGLFRGVVGTTFHTNVVRLTTTGALDASFNARVGGASPLNLSLSAVDCLAVQADGTILVGGAFTSLDGVACAHLGRLNSDGTRDTSFNSSASAEVYALALQADGRILACGGFASLGGQNCTNLGRLNADGSLDTSFNMSIAGSGVPLPGRPSSSTVYSLALQPDGNILVGGTFIRLDGQSRYDLARLINTDAAYDDLEFDGYTASWWRGLDGPEVWRVTFDACTNGTDWLSLGGGTRVPGGWQLSSLALPVGTSLRARGYLGGGYGDGSAWFVETAIGPPVMSSQPGDLTNVALTTATFTALATGAAPLTWQWVKDGMDLTDGGNIFGSQTSALTVSNVLGADSGQYLAVISNPSGAVTSRIASLTVLDPWFLSQPLNRTNPAGTTVSLAAPTVGTPPLTCQWSQDGVTLANGGNISGAQTPTLQLANVLAANAGGYVAVVSNAFGVLTSQVARLTVLDPYIAVPPASQDLTPGQTVGLTVAAAGTSPLAFQWRKDGVALAGATTTALTLTNVQAVDAAAYDVVISNSLGTLTSAVAALAMNLVTLDPFEADTGGNYGTPAVCFIVPQPDLKILVGGQFDALAGGACAGLGRVDDAGALDPAFNAGTSGEVQCLALQPDGKVLVGGYFNFLAGQSCNSFGRLNSGGSLDATFATNGPNYLVYCLAAQADGKTLVAGDFTAWGGQPCSRIVRLSPDGSLDTNFCAAASNVICCLALQPDGSIRVGGGFTNLNGQPCGGLGRLHADGSLDATFNPGANGLVYALAIQPDGKILVGGQFTLLAGLPRSFLGRLHADGSLDTRFTAVAGSTPGLPGVYSLALQADGKILVAGQFATLGGLPRSNLGRLTASGLLDLTFDAEPDSLVGALAIEPDGRVLAGGSFGSLLGQARGAIGRLGNTAGATQSLAVQASSITWLRGGTSPEVWRTSFETSADTTNWVALGAGTRIPGGWQLTGVSVPPGSAVRARGYVAGGEYNGSSWFVESTLVPLAFLVNEGTLGLQAGQFGFDLAGVAGQTFVLEASTNLADWTVLATNSFGASPLHFGDTNAPHFPRRFYRAHLQ